MPVTTVNVDAPNEVLYSDGEGIVHTDLQEQQEIASRRLQSDYLGYGLFRPGAVAGSELRPLHNALEVHPDTGANLDIKVLPGMSLQVRGLAPTNHEPFHDMHATPPDESLVTTFSVDTNGPNADPRFDIVSAQIILSDGDSVSRDFKDAVTKGLTSQSFDKRRRRRLEITYTPGTPAASPVEPALPAGHTKLARIELAGTQTTVDQRHIIDYRKPLGYGSAWAPLSWAWSNSGEWVPSVSAGTTAAFLFTSTAIGDSLWVPLRVPSMTDRLDVGVPAGRRKQARLARLRFVSNIAVGGFVTVGGYGGINYTTSRDISSLVTFGSSSAQDVDLAVQSDEPVWASGFRNALTDFSFSTDEVWALLRIVAGGAGDTVTNFIEYEWYGTR